MPAPYATPRVAWPVGIPRPGESKVFSSREREDAEAEEEEEEEDQQKDEEEEVDSWKLPARAASASGRRRSAKVQWASTRSRSRKKLNHGPVFVNERRQRSGSGKAEAEEKRLDVNTPARNGRELLGRPDSRKRPVSAGARRGGALGRVPWEVRVNTDPARPASAGLHKSRLATKLIKEVEMASHLDDMHRNNVRKHDEIARLKMDRRNRISAHKRAKQKKLDDAARKVAEEKAARLALKREAAERRKRLRAERRRRKLEKKSATLLQKHFRGWLQRLRFAKELSEALRGAILMQRQWHAHKFRRRFAKHGIRHKIVTLQRAIRAAQLLTRVVRIQAFWRGNTERYNYAIVQMEVFLAAAAIQRLFRLSRLRRWVRRGVTALVRLQWWIRWRWRVFSKKNASAIRIQASRRRLNATRVLKRSKAAAVKIESTVRGSQSRSRFVTIKSAVVMLQKACRRHWGRKYRDHFMAAAKAARAEYDAMILSKKTKVGVWVQVQYCN